MLAVSNASAAGDSTAAAVPCAARAASSSSADPASAHSSGDAVARAAYDLLTGDHLARVKVCAGCHWLFLDRSKNGSRRWCSMEDCGTSAKMRRYVARRAARRASSAAPGH